MSDREYKIKISTDAGQGIQGAQQTAQALDEAGSKTEAFGRKTEAATGHVDKHVLSHKQLHKIIHGLNQAVPLLGTLLQAALSPISATITVGILVLEHFKEKLKEVNDELDKAAEEAAKPVLAHENLAAAALASATAHDSLRSAMDQAHTASSGLTDGLNDEIAALRHLQETQAAVDDATKANAMAKVHYQMGQRDRDPSRRAGISAEEGYKQLAAIEEHYAQIKRTREENAKAEEQQATQHAAQQVNAQRGPLYAKTLQAGKDAEAARQTLAEKERGKDAFERTGSDQKSAQERTAEKSVDEAAKRAAVYGPSGWKGWLHKSAVAFGTHDTGFDEDKAVADEELALANKQAEQAREESDRYAKAIPELSMAKKQADDRLKEAQADWKAWQAAVEKLADDYTKVSEELGTLQQRNAILAPIEAGTRGLNTRDQTEAARNAQANELDQHIGDPAWLHAHGYYGSKNPRQNELQSRLYSDLPNASGELIQVIERLLEQVRQLPENNAAKFRDLSRKVEAVEQQIRGHNNRLGMGT